MGVIICVLLSPLLKMGAFKDESVVVHRGKHEGDPSEITVNCPDKVGLGCDLARTVFEFGLSVVKGGDDLLLIVLFQTIQTTEILLEFEKNSFHLQKIYIAARRATTT